MTGGIIFIQSADQGLWRVEKVPMSRERAIKTTQTSPS